MTTDRLGSWWPRLRAAVIAMLVIVTTSACAASRSAPAGHGTPIAGFPPLLTWMGEFTRPSGAPNPLIAGSQRFGSLSGLVLDATSGQWLSVIDDRAGSRVAWLSVTLTGGRFEVSPTRVQALSAGPGVADRIATQSDLEAIAALPDGTFLMGEEGHVTRDGVWQPAILQVTRDGVVTGVIGYPKEFQISVDGRTGVRDNQGFESLTRTPGGRLIAGLEQPLAEHAVTTSARGGEGRLIEFEPSGATWKPGRQWRYTISPTPKVDGFPNICSGGENGLVELLAISETTLIALERACLMNEAGTAPANAIQLFSVTLSGNTARKTLLLDLSKLAPKLSPALAHLENFEGLAFGPTVGGLRTLLVMSDDNFRPTQKTSFLLLGMK